MAEIDLFERSLAGAFLRLVDDVPGTVDAGAVARRVALEHPRRGWRPVLARFALFPRVAWILLLVGLIVGLAVGGLAGGIWRPDRAVVAPLPTSSPVPSLPPDFVGTWISPRLTLVLDPCTTGEECGSATVSVDEICDYRLTYHSRAIKGPASPAAWPLRDAPPGDYNGVILEIGGPHSFACGWSPWPGGLMGVALEPNGTLKATGPGGFVDELHRVDRSPVPSTSP